MPSGSVTSRAPRWRQTLKTPWALALVVAHEEQALAADVAGDERAARGERLRVADADPAAEEEVLRLPGGDLLVDVGAGRELAGLEQRAAGLRELGLGEGRRHGARIYQEFVRLTTWSGSRRLAAYDRLRRDRRRRGPQRAHRRRIPRAGRAARLRGRAPRHPRRGLRDRGGVAGASHLARLLRGLAPAADGGQGPAAQGLRLRGPSARSRLRGDRRRRARAVLPQRPAEDGRVARALLEEGRRGAAGVRGAARADGRVPAAADAQAAADARLQAPGRPVLAAARGGARRRPVQARRPRLLPRDDDVGRRPARRLVRERPLQGRDRLDRRRRRVGRAAHAGHRLQPAAPRARRDRRRVRAVGARQGRHGRDLDGDREVGGGVGRDDPHRRGRALDRRPRRARARRDARVGRGASGRGGRLGRAPQDDGARPGGGRALPGRGRRGPASATRRAAGR